MTTVISVKFNTLPKKLQSKLSYINGKSDLWFALGNDNKVYGYSETKLYKEQTKSPYKKAIHS